MSPKATLVTALGVAAIPVLTSPAASEPPPHATPTIEIASTNGSGCRPETVTITPEPNGFTVKYSRYSAKIGGEALPTDFRKNCQLNLRIVPPKTFTYAVMRIDHRGSAQLAPDATGVLKASQYYAGAPGHAPIYHSFKGPFSNGWQATETIDPGRLIYVPCGEERNLNISTELRLTAPDRTRASTLDMHADLGSTYHFTWRNCPSAGT
ncbi:DUF4360 domain-containing protein [Actinomadura sp. 1N219]|uniref:DUF4360 domain-containing protein n=1 Tax=Actinomadura sp. 1N219 TaxID=3375152 RepID=UPI0037BB3655